jgi:uncharacterized protein involved in exopolysaccharide biosynthesis/LysM repeat protein
MDFNQFFRIIRRNLLLLIGVPLVLAISVYFFSKSQPKFYSSETTVYTGIASGYSITTQTRSNVDYYGTNLQFDNLINIINSRSTKEKTAIRLLAQHLCLEHYNDKYISQKNYNELQRIVPKEVKDLIVKYGKTGAERDKIKDMKRIEEEIKSLEQQYQQKRNRLLQYTGEEAPAQSNSETTPQSDLTTENGVTYHVVSYGESLSSIASSYGLSVGELIALNNLRDSDIQIGDRLIVSREAADYSQGPKKVANQYHVVRPNENIYSIAQKYGITVNQIRNYNQLGTDELQPGTTLIVGRNAGDNQGSRSASGNTQQTETIDTEKKAIKGRPKDAIIPPGVNESDYNQTVENLMAYYQSSDSNFIYKLLQYSHPHYSISAISNLQISRVQNSDLVKITYTSNDPGICQQTLKILTNVFIDNYLQLRVKQTSQVVKYFEDEVAAAAQRLRDAEARLLQFKQANNIINYNEQTEAISLQKEELDRQYQNMQIEMLAARASLDELESKLARKDSIFLKSDLLTNARKELSDVTTKLLINQVAEDNDAVTIREVNKLKRKKKELEDQMKLYLDQLHMYQQSIEGIQIKDLLDNWLKNTIKFESAKASLGVLEGRKREFQQTYSIFAPLGATLKRIDREISVAEKEYLELLKSLNDARMRQQNLEMTSNLKVVDPPFYPLTVTQSRTKLLMVVAAFLGFILVLFIILMLEFFDTSGKSPERITKSTGLTLAGAFPDLNYKDERVDMPYIINRMTELIIQNLSLQLRYTSINKPEKPYFILIFSTQPKAGKTTIGHHIKEKLESYDSTVLLMNYKSSDENIANSEEYVYDINNRFFEIDHVKELLDSSALREDNIAYDYILLEIPSIIHNSYPLDLMKTIDGSLLISNSKDSWKKADKMALENFMKVSDAEPMVILNQAGIHVIDELLHGIPSTGKTRMRRIMRALSAPFRIKISVKDEDK